MRQKLMKGNEAVVCGALLAHCDAFYGYPITPASEIAHAASSLFPRATRTFIQAESEIAAINMIYGASCAGARCLTASSGPGISLKMEGISYLAAAELPAVIVDVSRVGPGLGNIYPDQSDYNQLVKGGGHGSYCNPVLAPNSVQEMCDFTMRAFDLADRYRTPVFVLSDACVGQMMEPVDLPPPGPEPPEKPVDFELARDGGDSTGGLWFGGGCASGQCGSGESLCCYQQGFTTGQSGGRFVEHGISQLGLVREMATEEVWVA